ncbi:MAG TPA: hypothetical protein PK691_01530 [Thermomicrobiales bacterium]|nr:hypothetical protein [Thermomicrobiales bacterium]HRA46800.1 hypothetical protein [Thermomicrobiales bacterium]
MLFVLIALMLIPAAITGARTFVTLNGGSPAVGRAQVITQGIAALPDDNFIMRIVERTAPAYGDAKVGRRALGFALATDEPILITDVSGENNDQFQDMARLAPGEAYMTVGGTKQIRQSLTDQPVTYIGIEFVRPDQGNEVGTGTLLYASDVLSTPNGQRDLDLVRNVLAQSDTGEVPDTGGSVLVLATDGAIDIIAGTAPSVHLNAGESAVFSSADLQIKPADGSAYGLPDNQLASLTNTLNLQTDDPTAGYVVVVIGPEVPKTGETPTATEAPSATAEATLEASATTVDAVPTDTAAPATGSIGVQAYLCPSGVTETDATSGNCTILPDGWAASVSGNGISIGTADASRIDFSYYFNELPLGTYTLEPTAYPRLAKSYVVQQSNGIVGNAIQLDATQPIQLVSIFFLQPPPVASTASLSIRLLSCPYNYQSIRQCQVPDANTVPLGTGANGTQFDPSTATMTGPSTWQWNVPADFWTLQVSGPARALDINGTRYEVGSAYQFKTDGTSATSLTVLVVEDPPVIL